MKFCMTFNRSIKLGMIKHEAAYFLCRCCVQVAVCRQCHLVDLQRLQLFSLPFLLCGFGVRKPGGGRFGQKHWNLVVFDARL